MVNLIFWTILLILWRTGEVGADGAITAILAWSVVISIIRVLIRLTGFEGISVTREEVSK